jgi:hypothetical protein
MSTAPRRWFDRKFELGSVWMQLQNFLIGYGARLNASPNLFRGSLAKF